MSKNKDSFPNNKDSSVLVNYNSSYITSNLRKEIIGKLWTDYSYLNKLTPPLTEQDTRRQNNYQKLYNYSLENDALAFSSIANIHADPNNPKFANISSIDQGPNNPRNLSLNPSFNGFAVIPFQKNANGNELANNEFVCIAKLNDQGKIVNIHYPGPLYTENPKDKSKDLYIDLNKMKKMSQQQNEEVYGKSKLYVLRPNDKGGMDKIYAPFNIQELQTIYQQIDQSLGLRRDQNKTTELDQSLELQRNLNRKTELDEPKPSVLQIDPNGKNNFLENNVTVNITVKNGDNINYITNNPSPPSQTSSKSISRSLEINIDNKGVTVNLDGKPLDGIVQGKTNYISIYPDGRVEVSQTPPSWMLNQNVNKDLAQPSPDLTTTKPKNIDMKDHTRSPRQSTDKASNKSLGDDLLVKHIGSDFSQFKTTDSKGNVINNMPQELSQEINRQKDAYNELAAKKAALDLANSEATKTALAENKNKQNNNLSRNNVAATVSTPNIPIPPPPPMSKTINDIVIPKSLEIQKSNPVNELTIKSEIKSENTNISINQQEVIKTDTLQQPISKQVGSKSSKVGNYNQTKNAESKKVQAVMFSQSSVLPSEVRKTQGNGKRIDSTIKITTNDTVKTIMSNTLSPTSSPVGPKVLDTKTTTVKGGRG